MTETLKSAVRKAKNVCLIVLGPHRSGTSALTGVLSKLGADLPESLMAATEANSKGYFESNRVMQFNDRLLAELGSRWDDIIPLNSNVMPTQVLDGYLEEAGKLLKEEFSTAQLPLLKDPRVCRIVGFWRDAFEEFGYTPVFIHTHRNPLETALSLQQRDGIPVEVGLLIWQRHAMDAEAATRGTTRVFTNYQNLLTDWRTQIIRIEEAIGFSFHRNTPAVRRDIEHFLQAGLRHQVKESSDVYRSSQVADVVRDTFQILDGWASGVLKSDDYDRLDQLRNKLDGAVDQVCTFVQALGKTQNDFGTQKKSFEMSTAQLLDEKAKVATELEGIRKEAAEKEAIQNKRIAELEQSNARLTAEKIELEAQAEHVQESLQTSLRERDNNIRVLERNIQTRFDEIARISGILLETENLMRDESSRNSAKLAELQMTLKESNEQNAFLQKELEAAQNKALKEHEVVTALLSSTSWKLTSPLRRFVMLFRK